jgi:hypothetical protein
MEPIRRCASLVLVGLVVGLTAAAAFAHRAPTPSERKAIVAGLPKDPTLHQRCVHYSIRVSTVDRRYALVGYLFPNPLPKTCRGFNGESVMTRGANGRWRQIAAGSEFDCDGAVPERVMRDLVKSCTYGESNHFYSPSRNIECVLRNRGAVLACVTFDNHVSAYLSRSGHVKVRPAPAASFFRPAAGTVTVVPYGQYWNCGGAGCSGLKPFECHSLETGMHCDVLDISGPSHGFVIAREGIRTF